MGAEMEDGVGGKILAEPAIIGREGGFRGGESLSRLLEGFPGLRGKPQGDADRLDGSLSLRCSDGVNRKKSGDAQDE